MYLTPDYKRRIRIYGPQRATASYLFELRDIETGEAIQNVLSFVLHAPLCEPTTIKITYAEMDNEGRYRQDENGNPVEASLILHDPECALTAWEV